MLQFSRMSGISLLLCVATVGCSGGGKSTRDPVYKVQGKVTYKGQPVADADVTFTCEAKNRSAFGKTNADGEFKLTTFRPNDGAVAGKHIVTVSKPEATVEAPSVPVEDPAYNPDAVAKPVSTKPKKNMIPAKYTSTKTSDLFWTVEPENSSEPATLELTD